MLTYHDTMIASRRGQVCWLGKDRARTLQQEKATMLADQRTES